ncbi:uncharacterized protein Z520_12201 [Fonsecaea multimorphosa CBS 102226]|uniref:DUF7770 domain-containing protein n=1 Tax=Fonsecaea multimorphosa CBS 102226 TaxID=1442371 RepID=A0A0D2JG40_9EURO|nr:uncharacterized protein Z520_12201 [Fonsecaea multimorphosa CBS 102226]KIX92117.1 hypothetical protein Z520_12201 [Fonsecaea multimorphosa CBS 102226]OAL17480.1 hypothetical protein AYO22_11612 [Fonsecaea multimorphosa]
MSSDAFQTAHFDCLEVTQVRVVVHNMGPVKPGADISYNHWSISLLTASPDESIRLDMQPEGPRNGELSIIRLPYALTLHAAAWFDFPVSPSSNPVTVRKIKDLLETKRRHRY